MRAPNVVSFLACATIAALPSAGVMARSADAADFDMAPPEFLSESRMERIEASLQEIDSSAEEVFSANRSSVPLFDKIVGWATAIASSRNSRDGKSTIVAVGDKGKIYRWSGTAWAWEKISGPSTTKKVFVGGKSKVFRLLENNVLELYGRDDDDRWAWMSLGEIPDRFYQRDPQIEVGSLGQVYYLADDRQAVYRWYGGEWQQIGGPAFKIAASFDGLFAVNPDKTQVWHYVASSDRRTPGWSLAFEFSTSAVNSHDYPEEISMNVVPLFLPVGTRPTAPQTMWDYERLWLKFPATYPHPSSYMSHIKYNPATKSIEERFQMGGYEARRNVETQRGLDTMVSFYQSRLIRKLQPKGVDGRPSWERIAALPDSWPLVARDYVDTGTEEMILGSNGFIYMNSGRMALSSDLEEDTPSQPAPIAPPLLLAFFGLSLEGLRRARARR